MKEKLFTKNFTLLVFAGILSAATIPTILLSPLGGILYASFGLKPVMFLI